MTYLTLAKADKIRAFKKMKILLFAVVVFSGFFMPPASSINAFADDFEGTPDNDDIEGTGGDDNIDSGDGDDFNSGTRG